MTANRHRNSGDAPGLPIDRVLSGLDKVKSCGAGKWRACCPAHDDKHPSLAVTELDDGVVLIKCWSGCSADEITASLGLSVRDLFPHSSQNQHPSRLSRQAIEFEHNVIRIALSMQSQGFELPSEDLERLEVAKRRVGYTL